MRARRLLLLSFGLNIALVIALSMTFRARQAASVLSPPSNPSGPEKLLVKTNLVVRRENFTWHQVESSDFRTYINNLRSISCPEATIRDIIVAEVNALYDRKRAEVFVPEQPWWRAEPSATATAAAAAQYAALDAERRALLAELLGSNWDTTNQAAFADFNLRLDGPILSSLSPRVKLGIKETEDRAAKRREEYMLARQREGKEPDPADLERLEQQTRAELAQLLNAEQLEEYLLRYSQTARNLRAELRSFELTPDEFRTLFRLRDPIEQQIRLYSSGADPVNVVRRVDLERQRESVTRQSLGPDRYQLFQFAQDPLFQQAQLSMQEIGAPAEAVIALYQINQATELERQRIRNDSSLTLEQRATALAQMLAEKEESLRRVLGESTYERYRRQQQ